MLCRIQSSLNVNIAVRGKFLTRIASQVSQKTSLPTKELVVTLEEAGIIMNGSISPSAVCCDVCSMNGFRLFL